jgi:D-galactarolactone cycloisomerase
VKVVSVEAIPIRAPAAQPYWGARSWGSGEVAPTSDYPVSARRRFVYSETVETCLVRLETESGVVGWGECKAPVAPSVCATLVDELLAPIVVGTSLAEIAVTWERMYAAMRVRGHAAGFWLEALAGVDIALWDAWARALGQPLHAMLGGSFRDSVAVYASGLPARSSSEGRSGLDALRDEAERLRADGWTAVKVAVGVDPEGDLASVATVREVFGVDAAVFADAAGAYDARQALALGRGLGDLGVGFFEMPVPPEDVDAYAFLAERLDVPLALDSLSTRHQALQFLRAGALHVLQPDVCRAGGITETMRIAALADAYGVEATPHVSIGSAIHFAASLQCAAATPNLRVMEHWIGDNPLGRQVAPDLDLPADGLRRVSGRPGLGITVDEEAVRRLAGVASG